MLRGQAEVRHETKMQPPELAAAETRPAPKKKEKPKGARAIETYYVGMPGSEHLVADTATGDQVTVRPFEAGSVVDAERTAIAQADKDALKLTAGKDPSEILDIAHKATEASNAEAKDLGSITKLLEEKKDMMLFVDAASIRSDRIPKEGLHVLIPKDEMNKLKPHVEELGYTLREIPNVGVVAEKGNSKLTFLHSRERGNKLSN